MSKVSHVLEHAAHYLAIGQDEIWLSDHEDSVDNFPWEHVDAVEEGSLHSYIGPRAVKFRATHPCGITFKWDVEFSESTMGSREEKPYFSHERLVTMAERLPPKARVMLGQYFKNKILPPLEERIKESQDHLDSLKAGRVTLNGIIAEVKGKKT